MKIGVARAQGRDQCTGGGVRPEATPDGGGEVRAFPKTDAKFPQVKVDLLIGRHRSGTLPHQMSQHKAQ